MKPLAAVWNQGHGSFTPVAVVDIDHVQGSAAVVYNVGGWEGTAPRGALLLAIANLPNLEVVPMMDADGQDAMSRIRVAKDALDRGLVGGE